MSPSSLRPGTESPADDSVWIRTTTVLRAQLPQGGTLPPDVWRRRHRGITALLLVHLVVLPVIGLWRGIDLPSVLLSAALLALCAAGACVTRLSQTTRSVLTTLGLVASSSIAVYFFAGRTEVHFHYFVVVAVVALYQAWRPYLVAVGFVLLQHGVLGTIDPKAVFSMQMTHAEVWTTAAVHSGFILAESLACVVFWRASEDALGRERDALGIAERQQRDLAQAQSLAAIGSWTLDLTTGDMTWSDQMYTISGQDQATFIPSLTASMPMVHPDDREFVAERMAAATRPGGKADLEYRLVRPDHLVRTVHTITEQPVAPDGTSTRRFGTMHDVTERVALQQEIEHLAYHDPLTGLANRRLFMERLAVALGERRTQTRSCAVLYLDLDGFKQVNDTFGHHIGDELLLMTADRLCSSVRGTDLVSRLGGDEFAILLEHVDLEVAQRLAQSIGTSLRRPMQLEGVEISVASSVGIAVASPQDSADDLIRNADAAMYAMKIHGSWPPRAFPTDGEPGNEPAA